MFYAINAADLAAHIDPENPLSPITILLGPILTRESVKVDNNRIDGLAVRVQPDLPAKRWSAIYQIIREGCGNLKPIPKHKLRMYKSRTGKGGWKRI